MRSGSAGILLAAAALAWPGCSDAGRTPTTETMRPSYDKTTGKLSELTYDANHNGKIDTWTEMDGARPVRSRIDRDENGQIDRWEYYDASGALTKVGFSRTQADAPDAWAFSAPGGQLARVDSSSAADEHKIDRREFYENGVMVRTESDTDGDGRMDQWETYQAGTLKTMTIDENGDGRPDRRLTYGAGGVLISNETVR